MNRSVSWSTHSSPTKILGKKSRGTTRLRCIRGAAPTILLFCGIVGDAPSWKHPHVEIVYMAWNIQHLGVTLHPPCPFLDRNPPPLPGQDEPRARLVRDPTPPPPRHPPPHLDPQSFSPIPSSSNLKFRGKVLVPNKKFWPLEGLSFFTPCVYAQNTQNCQKWVRTTQNNVAPDLTSGSDFG